MSKPKTRKRIYTLLGLLTLLYTIFGFMNVGIYDTFDPAYRYNILNDPNTVAYFMIITGIPLFLIFVFLAIRAKS